MADSTLDSALFWLVDNWPGTPWQGASIPTDGFTGTSHHNLTTAAYPVGTKIQVLCTHTSYDKGLATFIYLRNSENDSTDAPVLAKHFVTPENTTNWWDVTNKASGWPADNASAAAVAVATMSSTTGRYGWFWCGGICPTQYVAALDGNFATDNAQVAGIATLSNLGTTSTTYGALCLSVGATNANQFAVAVTLKDDTNL